jgi:mannose-1-phosphate guanylyltransferase
VEGERWPVKKIVVNPGARLSLQMHHHRAEHWVVVQGTAVVEKDGVEELMGENQSTYIPSGREAPAYQPRQDRCGDD